MAFQETAFMNRFHIVFQTFSLTKKIGAATVGANLGLLLYGEVSVMFIKIYTFFKKVTYVTQTF